MADFVLIVFFMKRTLYCGVVLPETSQLYKRKYCSKTCGNKYKLRKKKPGVQAKLWQHEAEMFTAAMELYWSGAGGREIACRFGIPVGTVYSWIHDYGGQKERVEPAVLPAVIRPTTKSPQEQFRAAETASQWLVVLRDSASTVADTFEDLPIRLVCGVLHGQSAGKLSGVISESLHENPLSGQSYAFCNKGRNTITVIAWKAPVFELSKYVKVSGTFIWPAESLGAVIEITRAEFERLLFIKRRAKYTNNLDVMRFSCYN
jgi:transposase-like protein